MTTATLRPNATGAVYNGPIVVTGGSGTAHGVTSDNSDASYFTLSAYQQQNLNLDTFTLPSGAVVKTIALRVRDVDSLAVGGISFYAELQAEDGAGGEYYLALVPLTAPAAIATQTSAAYTPPVVLTQTLIDGLRVDVGAGASGSPVRVHEVYLDVVYATVPVVTVTNLGIVTTSSSPAISWSYTQGSDGGVQSRYQVRVFSAAQYGIVGFDPETSPATYDSGIVFGSAVSHVVGPLADATTYRAYVRAAQTINGEPQWSVWNFDEFEASFNQPILNSVTALGDDTNARIGVTVVRPRTFAEYTSIYGLLLGFDLAEYDGSGDLNNLGSQSSLDATLPGGTNDPSYAAPRAAPAYYQPDVASSYLSVPDDASFSAKTVYDWRAAVELPVWPPTSASPVLAHRGSAGNIGWSLEFQTSGALRLVWSTDGTATTNYTSTAYPAVAGSPFALRVTLDTAAGGTNLSFYIKTTTAATAKADTQLSTGWTLVQSIAGPALAPFNTTAVLQFGASPAAGINAFLMYADIRVAIAGAIIRSFDPSLAATNGTSTSWVAADGATVTVNRGTGAVKKLAHVYRRALGLYGTDDYRSVAHAAALDIGSTQNATFFMTVRQWPTLGTGQTLAAKRAGTGAANAGWSVQGQTATTYRVQLSDGTNVVSADTPAITVGAIVTIGWVLNRSTQTLTAYANGVAGTPASAASLGAVSNTEDVRIGRLSGAGTSYGAFEFYTLGFARPGTTNRDEFIADLVQLSTEMNAFPYQGQSPTWQTILIERSLDAGTTWEFVRGLTDYDISGEDHTATFYDYETPNGTLAKYRARSTAGAFSSELVESNSDSWDSTSTWLKDPADPNLNLVIIIESQESLSYRRRQGVFYPLGRRGPVTVSDVRQLPEGPLSLITLDDDDADDLLALLDSAVLLLQGPPTDRLGSRYISIGGIEEIRPSDNEREPTRTWSVPFREIDRPADAGIAALVA